MAGLLLTMLLGTWALNGPPAAAPPPTHFIAYVTVPLGTPIAIRRWGRS